MSSYGKELWDDAVKYPPSEDGRYWCFVSVVDDLSKSGYQTNCSYSKLHGFMENMKPVNVTHYRPLMPNPTASNTRNPREYDRTPEQIQKSLDKFGSAQVGPNHFIVLDDGDDRDPRGNFDDDDDE